MPRRHTDMEPGAITEPVPCANVEDQIGRCAILALHLVEKRFREGTASSQETTYFLKYLSKERELEQQKMEADIILAQAKVKALEASAKSEEFQQEVLRAFAVYNGADEEILDVTDVP